MSTVGEATAPTNDLVAKYGPTAPTVLLGAAAVGLISCFLPAVTVSVPSLGVSDSFAVFQDWRGKLCFVGYIAAGVMAFRMLKNTPAKNEVLGSLITAGVVVLIAVWLLDNARHQSSFAALAASIGIGCYLNALAGIVLAGGAAVLYGWDVDKPRNLAKSVTVE